LGNLFFAPSCTHHEDDARIVPRAFLLSAGYEQCLLAD
jgi:hypothetical protein